MIFGSKQERDIKKIRPVLEKVKSYYEQIHLLSDEDLRKKTDEFRERLLLW